MELTALQTYHIQQVEPWLVRVRIAATAYRRAQGLVDVLTRIADGVAGIDYTAPHVSGGAAHDIADKLDGLEVAKRNAETLGATYKAELDDAARRLAVLPADYQTILAMYYLEGRQWREVAEEMDYSLPRIYQLRREALLAAYEVIPTEWRDPRPGAL